MKIQIVKAGLFKLDGGAMFGVVPKKLWRRFIDADENNMITWSTNCLYIETGDKKILIDTGLGNKQDEKFRSHFEPHGDDDLISSLQNFAISSEEITDVFLTHFHFDHVGGALQYDNEKNIIPTFPNAVYWSNEMHYNWALNPNPRERASFLKENFVPLKEQGRLKMIDVEENVEWMEGINIKFVFGHTEAMMLPLITMNGKKVLYCADLMPSVHHIPLPYVMSYDIRPLNTLKEKKETLEQAVDEQFILIFEHDAHTEAATVKRNERGRIVADERGKLSDFID